MLRFIHISHRFSKQLNLLEKADRKANLAAAQAESIIESYQSCAAESDEVRNKRTKHGESRLRNCLKYDLGGGYRLIAVRDGIHLFFVCVGSHDDIDLWLERNRGYSISVESQKEFFKTIELDVQLGGEVNSTESRREYESDDSYEEDLITRLDEKTMRQLFGSFYTT
jgi:hypothetical protein